MHSESRENMVKCYVIYKNCYHYHNINVKNQIGMHNMAAPRMVSFYILYENYT